MTDQQAKLIAEAVELAGLRITERLATLNVTLALLGVIVAGGVVVIALHP